MITEHSVSRRTFVSGVAALAASGVVTRPAPGRVLLHVGTYTVDTKSAGVYRYHYDTSAGTLDPIGASDGGPNPAFLARAADRPLLVVANEVDDWEGKHAGAVSSYAIDASTGALTLRNRKSSGGTGPAYVSLDRTSRHALVANYGGGSIAVLPLAADGTLGDASAVIEHTGSGPNKERQEAPHAHCILADPTNRWVLATDLGTDQIDVYRFDAHAGTLAPAPTPFAATAPGAGPRHLAFHPNGQFLYVVAEMALTLGAFRWDAAAGTLAALQTLPIVAGLAPGDLTAADVHVAPSGRFLYATVRGDDSVAVHAIDPRRGTLTFVQRLSTEGKWPRNFGLDPSGRFLLVANQHSDDITIFRVDQATGRLAFTGRRVSVPSPVCIRFAV